MAPESFRIGEVAARAGVSVDTVRYYEQQKLLPRAPRTQGGFRLFGKETIERVLFIKQAQGLGLSLDEIRSLLPVGRKASDCRLVRDLLRAKVVDLEERMKAMKQFQQTLGRYLEACERELNKREETAECPVITDNGQAQQNAKARIVDSDH